MSKIIKIAAAPALCFFLFFYYGCVNLPNKLVAPNWNVDLTVPIANKSYSLSDIIKQQKYISEAPTSGGQSIYLIQSDKYSQSIGVSKFISVTSPTSLTNQKIPALNSLFDSTIVLYLPIPEGAELDSAKFIGGSFSFHFNNTSQYTVDLNVVIPAVRNPDGSAFSENIPLAPNSSNTKYYSFANESYKVTKTQIAAGKKNCVELRVKAVTTAPIASFVTMDFYSSDFLFSYVSGYLPTKNLGSQSDNFNLSIGNLQDYSNKVTLKNANLKLSADYVSAVNDPFDIEISNLNIVGTRSDGRTMYLTDKSGNKNFNLTLLNGSLDQSFNETNSNITDFLSFLPDKISISADYIMNPQNNKTPYTATIDDSVKFSTSFSTESYLAINNASITDTMKVNFTQDNRTKIENGQNFKLNLDIQNGIPLSSSVTVVFADSLYRPLFTLNDPNGNSSFSIDAATVDQNGVMKSSSISKKTLSLNTSQISMLSKAYYAIYTVSISTPNAGTNPPTIVAVRPEDRIAVQASGSLNYDVKPDNL